MSEKKFKLKINYRKLLKRIGYVALMLFVVLCILEISYRYQWIDYYNPEFDALNESIDDSRENILVFGDSFTAHPNGYIEQLRDKHPEYNFLNAAIPGTGPLEMAIMASRRVNTYSPKKVIYQIYLGNDLIDIDPITNWSTLSFSRNFYWASKRRFQILGFFSRRIKGVQSDFDPNFTSQTEASFSAERFSPRTKMLVQASSGYVNECAENHANFSGAYDECVEQIKYLKGLLPKETELTVVVIPHFSQVNQTYNDRYIELGGTATTMDLDYPFVTSLTKDIEGVEVLNALGFLRAAEESGTKMFFENDPHLSDSGQLLLSNYLDLEIFLNDE